MKLVVGIMLWFPIAMVVANAEQPPGSPRNTSPVSSRSVLQLTALDDHDKRIATASCFAIAKDRVVTARHTLIGATRAVVSLRGVSSEATVWASEAEGDLAILVIRPRDDIVPLRISHSKPLAGAPVVVQRDANRNIDRLEGVVFAERCDVLHGPRVTTTCAGELGDSGAPLLNSSGEVVGVIVSRMLSTAHWQLNATPATSLRAMLIGGTSQSVAAWNVNEGSADQREVPQLWDSALTSAHGDKDQEAVSRMESVVKLTPRDAEAWYTLAVLCMDAKDDDRLRSALQGWDAAGVRADLRMMIEAQRLVKKKEFEHAIELLEAAGKVRCSSTIFQCIGAVRASMGDVARASAAYQEAAGLDSADPSPWQSLAQLQIRSKDFKSAIDSARRWAALEWSDLSVITLGRALGEAGDSNGARDAFEQALQRDPKSVRAHQTMAWWLGKQGEMPKAIDHLETAVGLEPANERLAVELAKACFLAKRYEKGRAVLQREFTNESVKAEALTVLVRTCYELRDKPATDAALERLRQVDPAEYQRFRTRYDKQ